MKKKNIFRLDNIAAMYLSTSVTMILTEVTGVVSILMDGTITSRFLGADAYSGISLLRPFSSVILMIAAFFSTGCGIICTQRVGSGDKESANEMFNLSGIAAAITFLSAPALTRVYSEDSEVISLTVLSIRWMSVALIFDTTLVLIHYYLQGSNNRRRANIISFRERLIVPVGTALILGSLYGSKGIFASAAVSKILLLLCVFAADFIRCKGFPKYWYDVMFLPEDFGGAEEDNMYAEIRNNGDAARESRKSGEFCLQHGTGEKNAGLMALFVEELTVNVLDHAKMVGKKHIYVNYRLFTNSTDICFSIMDLGDRFDPTLFYELNKDKDDGHLGIRLVIEQAKEVRYFSAFNSNNLLVYLDLEQEKYPQK